MGSAGQAEPIFLRDQQDEDLPRSGGSLQLSSMNRGGAGGVRLATSIWGIVTLVAVATLAIDVGLCRLWSCRG